MADDPCVILFTSGSESVPKGVPLTHRNVLVNVRVPLELGLLQPSDSIFGFLPPFHSFGFTVLSVLPLVAGVKTAYYPNPTHSRRLAAGIAMWKPTVTAGTPTFISSIFRAARADELRSLRLNVIGAEKAPDSLFETSARLCGAEIIEGYGITETAPILTLNRPGQRVGVGRPAGDVQLRIVDPDTRQAVATGEVGLILVCGSNVFGGYLGPNAPDPFVHLDGKRWYVTGDLGSVDEAGNLRLAGRLKRFVKVGGEMVSLPAMEEAIQQVYPNEEDKPRSALTYIEREGQRPLLCLYTTFDCTVEEVNKVLKDAGFSNLARVVRVEKLEAIPVLGTGKTDYRQLTEMLRAWVGQGIG